MSCDLTSLFVQPLIIELFFLGGRVTIGSMAAQVCRREWDYEGFLVLAL